MIVRDATEADIPQLLELMRELAVFEQYIDVFAVTAADLLEQGFRQSPPHFSCLVAADTSNDGPARLYGMLVYYIVPFTMLAKPTLFIKVLYVVAEARSSGIGRRLMQRASQEAVRRGCGSMRWYVAAWNDPARKFYEHLGAAPNPQWIDYSLPTEAMHRLAALQDTALEMPQDY